MLAPETLDIETLIRTGERVTGQCAVADLPALVDRLFTPTGDVAWQASAGRDEHGRARVHLALQTTLQLQCQRCLGAQELVLKHGWQLGVVADESALPDLDEEGDEVDFIVADGQLQMASVLSEEILLTLPMMPLHALDSCEAAGDSDEVQGANLTGKRNSPFAALKGLGKRPS